MATTHMLTVAKCEAHLLYLLGYGSMPAAFSALDVANEAGHHMANAGPWNFMRRHGTIAVVSGQSYVDLSALVAFREMIDVQYSDGTTSWLQPSDYAFIQERRGLGDGSSDRPTYWAVEPDTASDGTVSYRLEIYNTPSGTGNFNCYYFGGWQVPQAGASSARVPVPDWAEGLFLMFLEAVAFGKQERETMAIDARINAVRSSTAFLDAQRRDRAMQINFGQLRGGGVARQQAPSFPRVWPASAPSI